jgi:hypothetical protein
MLYPLTCSGVWRRLPWLAKRLSRNFTIFLFDLFLLFRAVDKTACYLLTITTVQLLVTVNYVLYLAWSYFPRRDRFADLYSYSTTA